MAVAARPGPSDARVPCPLCGGLIHPIAGKCKHCKADLTTYHSARPAAATPLPALLRAHGGEGHVNGHAAPAHAAAAHAAPIATAHEVSQPVLPPRPTVHHAAEPRTSGWRSWPVLVIILATIAIVIAAVLMVWPATRSDRAGKRALHPPPAPERMDQSPLVVPKAAPRAPAAPPQGTPDPWGQPPPAPPPPDPSADLQDDDDMPNALSDPFAGAHGRGRHNSTANGREVMLAIAVHLCKKMSECGNDGGRMLDVCAKIPHGRNDAAARCPAAERCLLHIDTMSCAGQTDDLAQFTTLFTQFRDCADAVRC